MSKNLDWAAAEQHLKEVEEAYNKIGSPGVLAKIIVINPVRNRFDAGERSKALWFEIMEIGN